MEAFTVYVPTYYGGLDDAEQGDKPEFAAPHVPLFVCRSDGLRIVLGTDDYSDDDAPDIHIERRPSGWAIFLHPAGSGDPSGYIYFSDDGRSFVVPESDCCTTPPIIMAEGETARAEVDKIKPPK